MCVICKKPTDLPKATGSADVKPLSRIQELPPLYPGCESQLLALRICNLDPTISFGRLAGSLAAQGGGTPYPSLGSTLQPDFWEICFTVAV